MLRREVEHYVVVDDDSMTAMDEDYARDDVVDQLMIVLHFAIGLIQLKGHQFQGQLLLHVQVDEPFSLLLQLILFFVLYTHYFVFTINEIELKINAYPSVYENKFRNFAANYAPFLCGVYFLFVAYFCSINDSLTIVAKSCQNI